MKSNFKSIKDFLLNNHAPTHLVDTLDALIERATYDDKTSALRYHIPTVEHWLQTHPHSWYYRFDIDNMSAYNKQHSHSAGDSLLKQVVTHLTQLFDPTSLVFRYGGDEMDVLSTQDITFTSTQLLVQNQSLSFGKTSTEGKTLLLIQHHCDEALWKHKALK